jgi:hypothetical protein
MKVQPKSGRRRNSKLHVLPLLYFFLLQLWSIQYQKLLVAVAGKIWAGQNGEGLNSSEEKSLNKGMLSQGGKPNMP